MGRRAAGMTRTNADGSQNIISQARLADEVRRLLLQSVKNERFKTPPTNAGIGNGVAQDEGDPRRRSKSRVPSCSRTTRTCCRSQARQVDRRHRDPGRSQLRRLGRPGHDRAAAGRQRRLAVRQPRQRLHRHGDGASSVLKRRRRHRRRGGRQADGDVLAGLGGAARAAGPGRKRKHVGPGSLVTPDHSQAGFLATYFGGDDPTDRVTPCSAPRSFRRYSTTRPEGRRVRLHPRCAGGQRRRGDPGAVPVQQLVGVLPRRLHPGGRPATTTSRSPSRVTTKLYVDGRLVEQRLRDDFGTIDTSPSRCARGTRCRSWSTTRRWPPPRATTRRPRSPTSACSWAMRYISGWRCLRAPARRSSAGGAVGQARRCRRGVRRP